MPIDEEEEGVAKEVLHAEDSRTDVPEVRAGAQPPGDRRVAYSSAFSRASDDTAPVAPG